MKIQDKGLDPRTKLIMVICISSLAVWIQNVVFLLALLTISVIAAVLMKGYLSSTIKKLRKMLGVLIAIVVIQSIFINAGTPILEIGKIKLLTDIGLNQGLGFILRIAIILVSAAILSTSSHRYIVQGLVEMKMPYEIAFMVSVAVRFLPMLMDEIKDKFVAIQLRGIDLKALKLRDKINLYSYIFTPVVVSTIFKAQKLSIVMECRGFRAYERRTSYLKLTMKSVDYFVIGLCVIITAMIGFIYFMM